MKRWQKYEVSEICSLSKEKYDPSKDNRTFDCIELEHISQETGILSGSKLSTSLASTKNYFTKGDVLFGKLRPYLKKFAIPKRKGVCSSEIWVLKPNNKTCSRDYLFRIVQSERFIQFASVSSGSKMPRADWSYVSQQVFDIPPLLEQKKIAEILGACDEAIEAQERLIALKQQRKKGLTQQLLTGKTRFPQFAGKPWRSVKASELFTTRSGKNTNGDPVLSVTQDAGILLRSEVERRISGASENYPNYKLVHPGDFVISLRSFQGGLEYSRIKGAVSPAYHVIHKKRELCEEFFRYYFKSWEFIGRLTIATIGIRDGKQIAFRDFSFMKFPNPSVEEQKAISSLLCAQDEELILQQTKLNQLKQQKKGLMQQLLIGKVRVKI